jgi:hypothetical protein
MIPDDMAVAHGGQSALAEGDEIEFGGDGVAFGGSDLDGGGIGGEGFCREFDFDRSACEDARTAAPPADGVWRPLKSEGLEHLVAAEELDAEIFPEVIRARNESRRRAGSSRSRVIHEAAVRIGKLNVNDDLHEFLLDWMIKAGLLSAVIADVTIGELCELDKWSEERDRRDVRTGFGRLEVLGVFVEEARNGSIVALAEEIGFADSFVGQGAVEGKGGWG